MHTGSHNKGVVWLNPIITCQLDDMRSYIQFWNIVFRTAVGSCLLSHHWTWLSQLQYAVIQVVPHRSICSGYTLSVESIPVISCPFWALVARLLTGNTFNRKTFSRNTLNRWRILVIFGLGITHLFRYHFPALYYKIQCNSHVHTYSLSMSRRIQWFKALEIDE